MIRYDSAENVTLRPWVSACLLPICWFFGLSCGIFLFLYAGTPVVSLMRRAPVASVSIVSLFGIGLIPFLFTAYAVFISELWLLFLICFCKAFLFSFVFTGISVAFSSAGWLMCTLLLFSDGVWCIVLYSIWLRLLSGRRTYWLAGLIFAVAATCMSYKIITPLLAGLIEL